MKKNKHAMEKVYIPPKNMHENEEHRGQQHQRESMDHSDVEEERNIKRSIKRSRIEMLGLYYAKVQSLQQTRQRKEVQIPTLSKVNQERFRKAMIKEVQNNIKTGAYTPMTLEESARIRQTTPEKVLESRYVCTAKPLEEMDVEGA